MNMQFITLAYFYLLTSITFAQEVDWQDIPGVCYSVCWEVASLSQGCAYTNGNNYIDCVCNNDVAPRWIPNCQACIAAVWRKDTNVNSLLNSCSFTSTTWTGATTITGSGTAAPTTETTTTGEGTSTASSSSTSVSRTSSGTRSSGSASTTDTGSATATGASQATSSASDFTGAAAPVATACFGMAAMLLGLPAIL
ncbi:hypothetical protein B0J12DRAFT_736053 [Macrophomina phaseolina]|uniref:Extracellular membrane protein CFEM domain-containing protein n=1 Tax=Macrophomina phaseolina TaxID=35725 RepID=A0ABQ8GQQ1_9PEZI|nr:hypothetical protein B0J12DRAFT_736053 [Macrophomina phaseolina]